MRLRCLQCCDESHALITARVKELGDAIASATVPQHGAAGSRGEIKDLLKSLNSMLEIFVVGNIFESLY